MTHAELVERAGAWLRTMGCSIVFEELVAVATREIPDAIGWRDGGRLSYLVECKTSRSDFQRDKEKAFRAPGSGMGTYRYFMCPAGMVRPSELPDRWGLLYCHPKKVTVEAGRHPRRWDSEHMARYYFKADREGELAMMSSALNRLRLDLGDARWRQRVQMPYTERQEQPLRRLAFLDDD